MTNYYLARITPYSLPNSLTVASEFPFNFLNFLAMVVSSSCRHACGYAAALTFILYASHSIQLLIFPMASSVDVLPRVQNSNAWAISCANGISSNHEFNRASRRSMCTLTATFELCVRSIGLYRHFSK